MKFNHFFSFYNQKNLECFCQIGYIGKAKQITMTTILRVNFLPMCFFSVVIG